MDRDLQKKRPAACEWHSHTPTVALGNPLRAALAVGGPGQAIDLQLHQALKLNEVVAAFVRASDEHLAMHLVRVEAIGTDR